MEEQTSGKKEVHLSVKNANCKRGMTGQHHISPVEAQQIILNIRYCQEVVHIFNPNMQEVTAGRSQ